MIPDQNLAVNCRIQTEDSASDCFEPGCSRCRTQSTWGALDPTVTRRIHAVRNHDEIHSNACHHRPELYWDSR